MLWCVFLLLLPIGKPADRVHRVQLWWTRRCISIFGIDLEVVNPELVVSDRPVVFMANHQSVMDIMVLGNALPVQYRWLAKEELFKIPLFGWGMRRTGYIPITRGSSGKARSSFYAAAARVAAGDSIMVFPEGTFVEDGRLLPFKNGGFIIAHRAKVDLQCVSISGAHAVMPDQEQRFMSRVKPGKIRVFIHPPIQATQYETLDVNGLKELAREQIKSEILSPKPGK